MTITLNLKTIILFLSVMSILAIVVNVGMDAFWSINEIAQSYSS